DPARALAADLDARVIDLELGLDVARAGGDVLLGIEVERADPGFREFGGERLRHARDAALLGMRDGRGLDALLAAHVRDREDAERAAFELGGVLLREEEKLVRGSDEDGDITFAARMAVAQRFREIAVPDCKR